VRTIGFTQGNKSLIFTVQRADLSCCTLFEAPSSGGVATKLFDYTGPLSPSGLSPDGKSFATLTAQGQAVTYFIAVDIPRPDRAVRRD
jgi:hypothetical protein